MSDIIKTHDDDVIFSYESLKEFIRLIQRQGINNLNIYSVSELLAGNKYQQIRTRDGHDNLEFPVIDETNGENIELRNRKGYFVFIRHSFAWQDGWNDEAGKSNNEFSGRHVFVKAINDINYYIKYLNNGDIDTVNSSIFSQDISTENPLPAIFPENEGKMKNGTFTTTVDNTQYVIKIKGFNDDGEYIGKVKVDETSNTPGSDGQPLKNNTDGYVLRGDGIWANSIDNNWLPVQNNKSDLGSLNQAWKNLYLSGNALPKTPANNNNDDGSDLGASNDRWRKLWAKDGDFSGNVNIGGNLTVNGKTLKISHLPSTASDSAHFWRGDGVWQNVLTGSFWAGDGSSDQEMQVGVNGKASQIYLYSQGNVTGNCGLYAPRYGSIIWVTNDNKSYIQATKVYHAVFNDYAECRKTIDLEPGRVVKDNDDGSLTCTYERLLPGAQVISDTYGDLMGETNDCKTPLAVAGRVLVYTYQPRENYHAGMAVCSAPNGTVDIMTREEIKNYPDCIIGIVSEIPNYEKWGTDQVNVDGRIWIKIK